MWGKAIGWGRGSAKAVPAAKSSARTRNGDGGGGVWALPGHRFPFRRCDRERRIRYGYDFIALAAGEKRIFPPSVASRFQQPVPDLRAQHPERQVSRVPEERHLEDVERVDVRDVVHPFHRAAAVPHLPEETAEEGRGGRRRRRGASRPPRSRKGRAAGRGGRRGRSAGAAGRPRPAGTRYRATIPTARRPAQESSSAAAAAARGRPGEKGRQSRKAASNRG